MIGPEIVRILKCVYDQHNHQPIRIENGYRLRNKVDTIAALTENFVFGKLKKHRIHFVLGGEFDTLVKQY